MRSLIGVMEIVVIVLQRQLVCRQIIDVEGVGVGESAVERTKGFASEIERKKCIDRHSDPVRRLQTRNSDKPGEGGVDFGAEARLPGYSTRAMKLR